MTFVFYICKQLTISYMHKKTVSVLFLILFTAFLSAPTLISVIEESFDTSVFYSVNEEENKGNDTVKIFEVKILETANNHLCLIDSEKENSYSSYLKNYTPFAIECFSPPPELS